MSIIPRRPIPLPVLLCSLLLFAACSLHAATAYFSFAAGDGGGAAVLSLDGSTGKIYDIQVLGGVTTFVDAKKLAVTGNGKFLILTSDEHQQVNVHRLETPDAAPQVFSLAAATEDVTPAGETFFLTLSRGRFNILDPARGNITWTWNARNELNPPGHKGESAIILAGGHTALASFQKDSETRRGSRIVVFDLQRTRFLHDIQLPRDRPQLHIDGNPKEQGPNPELLFAATASNTLVYSMDLYGGLGFMDLDAALQGRMENHSRISTALDGSWGTAFPDRGTLFAIDDREYLLISNASEDGGYVLVDIAAREIRQKFPSPSGGEHPVWFAESSLLASGPSGKVKSRSYGGLEKERDAKPALHLFDVAPLVGGGSVGFEEITLPAPIAAMARVGRFLIVFTRDSEVLVFDPKTKSLIDRRPTPGRANRVAITRS